MTVLELLNSYSGLIAVIVTVIASGLFAQRASLKATAEGWKMLAEQKSATITSLESRVSQTEANMAGLRSENDYLRNLNLRHQTEVIQLREQVTQLEARVGRGECDHASR